MICLTCPYLLPVYSFSGNSNLHVAHNTITHPVIIIVCVVIGAFVLLVAAVGCYLFAYNRKKKPSDGLFSLPNRNIE